jgi:hypothetical protein
MRVRGCEPGVAEHLQIGPSTPGPLRLDELACLTFQAGGSHPILLSPDGRAAALWDSGEHDRLEMVPLGGTEARAVPLLASAVFRGFVGLEHYDGAGFAWARDSGGLWAVRQDFGRPGGWARGPLEPVEVRPDGAVRALPQLRHPAGPLDAVKWIGGEGLALVQFGTRGSYYRPGHDDPAPTLAMVDARRGRVLATLPVLALPEIGDQVRAWGFVPRLAVVGQLPDGRLRAVLLFNPWRDRRNVRPGEEGPLRPGQWLVWTQGEAPLVRPYAAGDFRYPEISLSPDARQLLVTQAVEASGADVEHAPSPPPTPETATAAQLLDLETGRSVWRFEVRAERKWNRPLTSPPISPDGRHALIALPADADNYMAYGLIEMGTGRILQRIKPLHLWTYGQSYGFTADGRRAWFTSGNIVIFYRLAGR